MRKLYSILIILITTLLFISTSALIILKILSNDFYTSRIIIPLLTNYLLTFFILSYAINRYRFYKVAWWIFLFSFPLIIMKIIYSNNIISQIGLILFFPFYFYQINDYLCDVNFIPAINFLYFIIPNKGKYILRKGHSYYKKGNFKKSLEFAEKAKNKKIDYKEYGILQAFNYFYLEDYKLSEEILLNLVLEYGVDTSDVYKILGISSFNLEHYNKAYTYLLKCKNFKNDSDVLLYLFYTCSNLEKYEEAIIYCQKYLQFKPDDANSYYNLGVYHDEMGNTNEALKNWEKSISLDIPDPKGFIALAYKSYDNDEFDKAIELYRKGIFLNKELITYVPDELKNDVENKIG